LSEHAENEQSGEFLEDLKQQQGQSSVVAASSAARDRLWQSLG
jgi:hypothetical protein